MSGASRRGARGLCLLAALATVLGVTAPAPATPAARVASFGYTYYPGDAKLGDGTLTVSVGQDIRYTNLEIAPGGAHSMTARDTTTVTLPDGTVLPGVPVFDTDVLNFNQSDTVAWLPGEMTPGRYEFYCTIHPSMAGVLLVTE